VSVAPVLQIHLDVFDFSYSWGGFAKTVQVAFQQVLRWAAGYRTLCLLQPFTN